MSAAVPKDGLPCPRCCSEHTHVIPDPGGRFMGCKDCREPEEPTADDEEAAESVDAARTTVSVPNLAPPLLSPRARLREAHSLLEQSEADMPWQVRHGMLLRANLQATLALADVLNNEFGTE